MYELLRKTVDTLSIVDDHAHLGFKKANDAMDYPAEEKMSIGDAFLTPEQASNGFPWLESQHRQAYKDIYGFTDADLDDPALSEQTQARYEEARHDPETLKKILGLANVEHIIGNLYIPKEFEGIEQISLIPTIDPLLFPFDFRVVRPNSMAPAYEKLFFYLRDQLRCEYGCKEDISFAEYLDFCDRVLEDYKKRGNVGYKFLIAYVRTSLFEEVDESEGDALWEKAGKGDFEAFTQLQDLLAWYLVRKATRLDMPIQIHTALIDPWSDYADPMNLMGFLRDEETYHTKFVLLHAGYPNYHHALTLASAASFITKNKVCVDISGRFVFANPPAIVAKYLRLFLDYPNLWDKVIYGSDSLIGDRNILVCSKTGREAVYLALEGMIDDGIVDETIAVRIAKDILRNMAIRLYKLPLEIL